MTKRSKAYRAAAEKIQSGVLYTPAEAVALAKAAWAASSVRVASCPTPRPAP